MGRLQTGEDSETGETNERAREDRNTESETPEETPEETPREEINGEAIMIAVAELKQVKDLLGGV